MQPLLLVFWGLSGGYLVCVWRCLEDVWDIKGCQEGVWTLGDVMPILQILPIFVIHTNPAVLANPSNPFNPANSSISAVITFLTVLAVLKSLQS